MKDEPDRLEWRAHGLDCLIVRSGLGVLCGYVGVPKGHPWHGRDYSEVEADVHGGLTFSGPCQGHICHSGRRVVHWLGFDCGHYGDLVPAMALFDSGPLKGTYRTIEYVKAETERLARQAARAWPRLKERRRAGKRLRRRRRLARGVLVYAAGMASTSQKLLGYSLVGLARFLGAPVRIPRSLR